jgi:hypothetical protein
MNPPLARSIGAMPSVRAVPLRIYKRTAGNPWTLALSWSDGTPFRVTVYTKAEWDALPEEERPRAWIDDTGRVYFSLTDA